MQQLSLTCSDGAETIHPNLPAVLYRQWLPLSQADRLWQSALSLPWEYEQIKCRGGWRTLKRKVVWVADPGITYRYTGRVHQPIGWTTPLQGVRERLAARLSLAVNSVLGNFYADGHQMMGYHQDNEPELGQKPCIASLSLGAKRRFHFRQRATGQTLTLSLLVSRNRQHGLPSEKGTAARINFTFRYIQPDR